ncbi:MAG TPA: hypothetical protein VML55_23895 [Planctomycetaceae bacterium]|nr:hypothetical protein [Planctomycetaceae bacterium]
MFVRVDGIDGPAAIHECVDPSSTIHTDDFMPYRGIGKHFEGGHFIVDHKHGEYVRRLGDTDMLVTSNEAESDFALLGRHRPADA